MRRWVTTWIWLAVAAAALWASSRAQPRLLDLRRTHRLNQGEPLENAPPLIAFTTVALGGFRGIAVDLLWVRAADLQQKGKFFELVTLSDWITKLQPRFAPIWSYHAWNLAFNVSVMFDKPEDRWRWVRHGLSLLRDEGLRYNPGSPDLYAELSWIFYFKLGQDTDTAHFYYKRVWAEEMTRLFGGDRPNYDDLLAAPADPADLRKNAEAAALLDALHAAGLPLDARWLDPGQGPPDLRARMRETPAGAELLRFVRARTLRETYRLDPAFMRELDETYGPLDWRMPTTQAIYWAKRGMPWARTDFQRLTLERRLFQSMSESFMRGRLSLGVGGAVFALSPNLNLLPHVRKAYEEAMAAHPGDATVQTAYRNFLIDATMFTYTYNRRDESRRLHALLRERFPGDDVPADFEQFVTRTYREFIESMAFGSAMASVEGAMYQSLYWRELGDPEQAAGFEQIARLLYETYMKERTEGELRERTGLPDLAKIRDQAVERVRADFEAARQRAAQPPERIKGPLPRRPVQDTAPNGSP